MIKNFLAYQWSLEIYREVMKIKAPLFIRDQMQRAALSVTLNLAEGAGRWGIKDQTRFYRISLGSFRELEACLDILEVKLNPDLQRKLAASLVKLSSKT